MLQHGILDPSNDVREEQRRNVFGAPPTPSKQIMTRLATVGTDAAAVHEAARPGELGRSVLDGELAAATLGFRPDTALASGIAMTWESIRSDR